MKKRAKARKKRASAAKRTKATHSTPPSVSKAPDLKEIFLEKAYAWWGSKGVFILVVLGVVLGPILLAVWNPESIKYYGVYIWTQARRAVTPMPKTDPNVFTIALIHLEGDTEVQSFEAILADELQGLKGVQVLQLDRTIALTGADLEEAASTGHDEARRILTQSGADAVLWGKILSLDGRSAARLYWTTKHRGVRTDNKYAPDDSLGLPEVFWDDVVDILKLVVLSTAHDVLHVEGRYVGEPPVLFVMKIRNLLQTQSQLERQWTADTRAEVKKILADSLVALGEKTNENEHLHEAISIYREVLQQHTRRRFPFRWASAQHGLGNALFTLGEHQREAPDADQLSATGTLARTYEAAIEAFRAALQEQTKDRDPLDWAAIQNGLGVALWRLALEEGEGLNRLDEAAGAFSAALSAHTREEWPLLWAGTQYNLGQVTRTRGWRTRDVQVVCEALQLHVNAWQVVSDSDHPSREEVMQGIHRDYHLLKEMGHHSLF